MLQIKNVRKQYVTGDLIQTALNNVSLNLRDNEFVAVLGPSGSGKTTLLNIIGGLDRYDSGDLIINNVSTKEYTDRDWDSYRNHRVGFIFQSYNLIPHQSVLSNVELALTISGVSTAERKRRAMHALEQVGLADQSHKRPNQLSGGQMQRVAIARALVNDPDILLADEPTGALDSKTSVQIMELLKQVASDRLVVMVTHNPDLASRYANRIVQLQDGMIIGDSHPYEPKVTETAHYQNMGKASMSFLTSLSLSFNNLRTKKARTFLTAFAGSIGIIGIALILSLSNGVQNYINQVEEETLSEYPLTITSTAMDLSAFIESNVASRLEEKEGEVHEVQTVSSLFSSTSRNDLASLRDYIENGRCRIHDYASAVEYYYMISPQIFRLQGDSDYRQISPDEIFGSSETSVSMSMMSNRNIFSALPAHEELYAGQYDLLKGKWPQNRHECVLVLSSSNSVTDMLLYAVGLKDASELDQIVRSYAKGEEVTVTSKRGDYMYDDFIGIEFRVVDVADFYVYDSEYDVYVDKRDNHSYMLEQIRNGETLTIVGIVKPNEDASAAMLSSGICYHCDLLTYTMKQAAASEIVARQRASRDIDVFTGKPFSEDEDKHLDLSSLFTIDSDAMTRAFSIDTGVLNMNALDFSDLKLDLSSLDLSSLTGIDVAELLSSLDININVAAFGPLLSEIVSSYQQQDGAIALDDVSTGMNSYLQSGRVREILSEQLQNITGDSQSALPDAQAVTGLISNIVSGFTEYLQQQGVEDIALISQYLNAYLESEPVQQMIGEFMASYSMPELNIDEDTLQQITDAVYADYVEYADENDIPTSDEFAAAVQSYMDSPEGKNIIESGINSIINLDEISQQLSSILGKAMEKMSNTLMKSLASQLSGRITSAMKNMMSSLQNSFHFDAGAFSKAVKFNMNADELQELMMSMMTSSVSSYENNLTKLNYATEEEPYAIYIYPKDFDGKNSIIEILDEYNEQMRSSGQEKKVIAFTDYVATLMSNVTDIVDTISYVLIAFVAISLVVSSIMIGIITYISVLERTKEIGILRAIGASKRNITQVFNAETFIVGLLAGLFGVGFSALLLIPGNALIHHLAKNSDINAHLPLAAAIILVIISIVLTLIGGYIPSKAAARKDPVLALRTE